jgi:hypothetical protein
MLLQESLRVRHSSHKEEKLFYAAESVGEFPSLPIRLLLSLSWLGPQHRGTISAKGNGLPFPPN